MRGKDRPAICKSRPDRITPAYAGKSAQILGTAQSAGGSPPRMRGKGGVLAGRVGAQRITPAYAGKSLTIQKMTTRSRDHPRVCGEKPEIVQSKQRARGSPPRMRGKVYFILFPGSCRGITPAYAGKSVERIVNNLLNWDHPRVCGEKYIHDNLLCTALGSPPRMRGKEYEVVLKNALHGITPAYAGKRCKTIDTNTRTWDHPRVCGEKSTICPTLATTEGSPPRMRGKDF